MCYICEKQHWCINQLDMPCLPAGRVCIPDVDGIGSETTELGPLATTLASGEDTELESASLSVLQISHTVLELSLANVHPGQFHFPGRADGDDSGLVHTEDDGKGRGLNPSFSHRLPQTVHNVLALSYNSV